MSGAPMIVFSGVDGAGKSTQIEALEAELSAHGHRAARCWARGGYTPLFSLLKHILRRTPGARLPGPGHGPERERAMKRGWVRRLWLTLAMLDLMVVYCVRLRWWRWLGRVVICDRYLDDTWLDFSLEFPQENIERSWLWRLLRRLAPKPDVTFLMLLPVAESMRRCKAKGEPFTDTEPRFRERLAHYTAMSDHPGFVVIDASLPIAHIASTIRARVAALITPIRAPAEEHPRAH